MEHLIENLINFNKNEIKIIEREATISVIAHLQEKYQTLWTLIPTDTYIKRFDSPFYDEDGNIREITELDGVIILSNDPEDLNDKRLNVRLSSDHMYNKQRENQLKKDLEVYNTKLQQKYDEIIATKDYTFSQVKTLQKKKSQVQAQVFRHTLKRDMALDTQRRRIFVIVETKHKVTEDEVSNKIEQLKALKLFFQEAKKYYAAANDYLLTKKLISTTKAQRSVQKRAKTNVSSLDAKLLSLANAQNQLYADLQKFCLSTDWTSKFASLLEYERLDFDDVLLFMGGPLWENDSLKHSLIQQGHHVLDLGNYRYQVYTKDTI